MKESTEVLQLQQLRLFIGYHDDDDDYDDYRDYDVDHDDDESDGRVTALFLLGF